MKRIVFALLLAGALLVPSVYSITVEVEDISNRNYFPAVLAEMNSAKTKITVAMYAMYIRYDEPDHPAYKLVEALIAAKARGVDVEVYLDNSPSNGKSNREAFDMLMNAGCRVFWIKPYIKLHAKLIVIDDAVVIEGSTNWTDKGIEENFESATLARGGEWARSRNGFFQALAASSDGVKAIAPELIKKVRVSNLFLTDEHMAARMFKVNDDDAFDLYLWLCRCEASSSETGWQAIDYKQTADYLRMRVESKHSKYRFDVRTVVKRLQDKYQLVDYVLDKENNIKVKIRHLGGGYFNVPLAYWAYGLDGEFNLREKFTYFVAIAESEIARPKSYWFKGQEGLARKYHVNRQAFIHGFGALEKADILGVRRSEIVPGKAYDDRKANQYYFKPLLSAQEKAQQWQELESRFDRESVAQGRALAGRLDKENDLREVECLLGLAKEYGWTETTKAINTVRRLCPNNPRRDTAYAAGILENWAEGE